MKKSFISMLKCFKNIGRFFSSRLLKKCPIPVSRDGFTLAEVLIVVAIIGVIVALVLPNLKSASDQRAAIANLQKTLAILSEAQKRAEITYGPIRTWFVFDTDNTQYTIRYSERIVEFLNLSKNCKMEVSKGCFTDAKSKHLNGNSSVNYDTLATRYKGLVSGGPSFAVSILSNAKTGSDQSSGVLNSPFTNYYGNFYVDVDGPNKGPNTWGIDLFSIAITQKGLFPQGSKLHVSGKDNEALTSGCFDTGGVCAGFVIETGSMDYLKADRTGKCPNGTQLSWEVPRCN